MKKRTSYHSGASERVYLPGKLALLYEDSDILVVDKPAGLLAIASDTEKTKTAYHILCEYLRRKGEKRRPAVVHRLDRDTSGVMLFVKSGYLKQRFMRDWDELVTARRYAALVEGIFPVSGADPVEGIIDEPLGEAPDGRMTVEPGGMRAVTRWKLLQQGKGYALLSLELETGRRNQIRVHLSHIGHPVAGDAKYRAKTDPLKRLALHAESLAFRRPGSGKLEEWKSPVPEKFWGMVKREIGSSMR
jgi:23S rRNA pseudouridine1911/1915/1917 synthase